MIVTHQIKGERLKEYFFVKYTVIMFFVCFFYSVDSYPSVVNRIVEKASYKPKTQKRPAKGGIALWKIVLGLCVTGFA